MAAKPIHEVFLPLAQGLAHLTRFVCPGMEGSGSKEPFIVRQLDESGNLTLEFERKNHNGSGHNPQIGFVRFHNIIPSGVSDVVWGEETTLKSEFLGSVEESVDNRDGVSPVHVNYEDLFSKSQGHEKTTEKSAGGSISVSVESEQDIEGIASFKESITAEAHTEFSESETSSEETGREEGGSEGEDVPTGDRILITQTRVRADTSQEVTAKGKFNFTIEFAEHRPKWKPEHHWVGVTYDSWQQFLDVINGDSPDNWPLADQFRQHPVQRADRWALRQLNTDVRYKVKFEGKIKRTSTS